MTSKLIVNNIEADAGVSTVTFNSKVASSEFVGSLTGTASTATAAATAYGISGSPTLSGISSVSTTNLTVNGSAYPSAGPLSNRNLIINGAMQVAQRGTSSSSTGFRTIDRFDANRGGIVATMSQESLSSGDPYNEGFRYFLRYTNNTPDTGTGAYINIRQKMEAQNIAQSGWNYTSSSSYVTLSFWVRSSVAQEFYGYFLTSDGTAKSYTFSTGSLSADTWTKVTKTIPGDGSLTIDNDNGLGLQLLIAPFWGDDYTDSAVTLDSWENFAGGTRTPVYTNTWANTTNATFDLTGIQLEVGSVATPFEHRSYGDELLRCQRYYYRIIQTPANNCAVAVGSVYTTTQVQAVVHFPVSMRAAPTALEQTGTASDYDTLSNGSLNICDSVPVFQNATTTMGYITFNYTSSTVTTGSGAIGRMRGSSSYLAWSSEL